MSRKAKLENSPITKAARTLATLLIGTGLLVSAAEAQGELIPAARRTDWVAGVNVGVPGGIPTNRTQTIDVTQAPYNADRTGASNAAPAIQAAINAATSGQIVYLPAGRYRLDSSLYLNASRDNITLRGAGMDLTILDSRGGNTGIQMGTSSDYRWDYPASNNTVTAGKAKGSTVLTVADTSAFTAGSLLNIAMEDRTDPASIQAGYAPVIHVAGYARANRQMSRLVSKTATTLTIYPGLYGDHQNLKVDVYVASSQIDKTGIEDLTIDCSQGTTQFGVQMEQAYACWIKGVKVNKSANYGFSIANSLNVEIRESFANERSTNGTNGGGILMGLSAGCLVEDNIIKGFFPLIEVNTGSCGNVFAYNFCYDSSVFGVSGVAINTNHGPHNSFNLYEGNVASTLQCDGYFGSASDDTIFRNFLHGTNPGITNGAFSVILNRFTRNYNIVGNVMGSPGKSDGSVSFGNPNLGNGMSTGTAKASEGSFWKDWKMTATLTTRLSDNAGVLTLNSGSANTFLYLGILWNNGKDRANFNPSVVVGNLVTFSYSGGPALPPQGTVIEVWPGAGGYQELDLDVETTALLKGNRYANAQVVPSKEAAASNLPASLYRTSKPAFFGNLAWPAYSPDNPNYSLEAIPAGYRYFNSTPPAPAADSAPSNVRIRRTSS